MTGKEKDTVRDLPDRKIPDDKADQVKGGQTARPKPPKG